MADSPMLGDSSTPRECTSFLEFADRLNIPVNQECLEQIQLQLGANEGRSFLDVGVKDSKGHKTFNDRRLQNAFWRAWWRQRRVKFNTGSQNLPLQDEELESMALDFVYGKEIGDLPTGYKVRHLEEHELPVIGTYVDPNVLPGFRYLVRVCNSKESEYLFEGKPLMLVRLGAGYGKRLTFEDENILSNENFFWSDSNPDGGFAFTIDCLTKGERFKVFDDSSFAGEVVITKINPKQQIICSKIDDSGVTLKVNVSFECLLVRQDKESGGARETSISTTGTAIVCKPLKSNVSACSEITEVNIPGIETHCVLRKII